MSRGPDLVQYRRRGVVRMKGGGVAKCPGVDTPASAATAVRPGTPPIEVSTPGAAAAAAASSSPPRPVPKPPARPPPRAYQFSGTCNGCGAPGHVKAACPYRWSKASRFHPYQSSQRWYSHEEVQAILYNQNYPAWPQDTWYPAPWQNSTTAVAQVPSQDPAPTIVCQIYVGGNAQLKS